MSEHYPKLRIKLTADDVLRILKKDAASDSYQDARKAHVFTR
jgi:hypothetical protein